MKKVLFFLGTITLIGTSTTSLVACDNISEYTPEKLARLKEKNKISTKDGILEWIAPQEKPFNQVDNKYYFAVWHINKNDDWRIIKFKHSNLQKKVLDKYNEYEFKMASAVIGSLDLLADENRFAHHFWWEVDDGSHFKYVYRWNNDISPPPSLVVNNKTGEIKVEE